MATKKTEKKGNRRGETSSYYMTARAKDLLQRVHLATRRSQSEILCLLIETYGPQLLADAQGGRR